MEGAFPAVASVTISISIEGSAALTTMEGAFSAVASVTAILIYGNAALPTMAFSSLISVQAVVLIGNYALSATATAFASLSPAGTLHPACIQPCLLGDDRARWVQALPTRWSTDPSCGLAVLAGLSTRVRAGYFAGLVAGLTTLVRAGYRLFRLPGHVIPAGDAKRWYRGLCEDFGLRPVACNEGQYGTQNRAYNAVPLPSSPFSCTLGGYITAQLGWPAPITFYQGNMGSGSGLTGFSAGQTGYPICTDHA